MPQGYRNVDGRLQVDAPVWSPGWPPVMCIGVISSISLFQKKLLRMFGRLCCFVWLVFLASCADNACAQSNSSDPDCLLQEIAGFSSPRGCIYKKLQSGPLRVIYLDVQYIVQNQVAIAKTRALGREYGFWDTCDTAATAIPEWWK